MTTTATGSLGRIAPFALLLLGLGALPAAATPIGIWAVPPAPVERPAPPAGAGSTVLDQPPNESCTLVSDAAQSQVFAENFVVSGDEVEIYELRFTGAYLFGNVPPATDAFEIDVHVDAAGLPGALVGGGCTHDAVAPVSRTPSGRQTAGFDLYDLVVPLIGGCVLAPGTYWLELYEGGTAGDSFSWECGDLDPTHGVAGSAFSFTAPGAVWTSEPSDRSLVILGAVFADGFESGDSSQWSAAVP